MPTLQSLLFVMLMAVTGLAMAATDDPYTEAAGFEINNALSGSWYNPDFSAEFEDMTTNITRLTVPVNCD